MVFRPWKCVRCKNVMAIGRFLPLLLILTATLSIRVTATKRNVFHSRNYITKVFIVRFHLSMSTHLRRKPKKGKEKKNCTENATIFISIGIHRIITSNYPWDSNRKVRNKMCLNRNVSYTASAIEYSTIWRHSSKGRSRFNNSARCWTEPPRR